MTTCKTCRYFAATLSRLAAVRPVDGMGECRRKAPRGPVALGWAHKGGNDGDTHAAIVNAFPFVPDDDWCGEYQSRASEEQPA